MALISRRFGLVDAGAALAVVLAAAGVIWSPKLSGAIAKATGARFFEAPTSEDLAAIYEGLGSRVGFTMEQQEVTQWFAAGALLMVLAGAGLAAFWFNRIP